MNKELIWPIYEQNYDSEMDLSFEEQLQQWQDTLDIIRKTDSDWKDFVNNCINHGFELLYEIDNHNYKPTFDDLYRIAWIGLEIDYLEMYG